LDWSRLPDLAAVVVLTCAFASVARQGQSAVSKHWLTGWLLIALHFCAFMFLPSPGIWGIIAADVGLSALTGAGALFMWAAIPYRKERSSRLMLLVLIATNTLYVVLLNAEHVPPVALNLSAALLGAAPLTIALDSLPKFTHFLRWVVVSLYCALSAFVLLVQHRPGNGEDLALNGVLFTAYFGCCIHVFHRFRRATTGAFITIAGFFAWAGVFVIAPLMAAYLPNIQLESEVWNLPKYIVAVGMILLLLEDQIAHNKYLALHDELTGLPNRRLFLDRLAFAMERARRANSKAAVLVVDLDHFKQVNDTLGHHTGDVLLQNVGALFSSRVRSVDTVARTGGDEFSLILEEPTSRSSAKLVAHTLTQLLKEPLQLGEHQVQVGASIGVAVYPDDASDLEGLCIAADLRMYDGKHSSREAGKQPLKSMPAAASAPTASEDSPLGPIPPHSERPSKARTEAG
jgi:diguanylate cyclase (GGDEF)-like protein